MASSPLIRGGWETIRAWTMSLIPTIVSNAGETYSNTHMLMRYILSTASNMCMCAHTHTNTVTVILTDGMGLPTFAFLYFFPHNLCIQCVSITLTQMLSFPLCMWIYGLSVCMWLCYCTYSTCPFLYSLCACLQSQCNWLWCFIPFEAVYAAWLKFDETSASKWTQFGIWREAHCGKYI